MRPEDMWRYREFLPVRRTENIVSLGEVRTPLIECRELGRRLGARRITIKDEGRLPTGSFKARGLCLAVSMAKELGVRRLAMPTNGNAGAAMAAYAARAGMESFVFCPDDTPPVNVGEIAAQGAHVWLVNGLINDCGRIVAEGKQAMGWFDVSTLKEPYRIEGKKTMGLELADQLNWTLPDVIFYPTGGGTGLDWHVESVRRVGPNRLDRSEAPANGGRSGFRLCPDRESIRRRARSRACLEGRPHRGRRNPRAGRHR